MNRTEFVKKVIQAGLFALLSLVVFALKNRIVTDGKLVLHVLRTEAVREKMSAVNY